ncbi:hypothetical protein Cylst_6053 [Cylindrospermum stagnale PCC 7417]|uniref:Uncharacterized protein n=1 Tax=Cylindrospermum stagnale PCC 7417 TaxID=56107 RepID=K9X7F9_9NOST|nr:hypothetical protein [Cylindrospermum stagnale]AFZ28026.1 hypothetical protein Cylst_6053 [Cylindrospermum stagnale PCC 7417]
MATSRELEALLRQQLNEDQYQVEKVLTLISMHCAAQSRKYFDNETSGDKYQDFRYWSTYANGIEELKTKLQNYIPPSTEQEK